MSDIFYKEESYAIIGLCMEVHNKLGHGFSEIVYKDALEIEFKENEIFYEREKELKINYKGHILKHSFFADLVVFDSIILEVKCVKSLLDEHVSQVINYLRASDKKLGLLINFGRDNLEYKRLVYIN